MEIYIRHPFNIAESLWEKSIIDDTAGGGVAGQFGIAYVIFMLKCNLINVRFQQHPLPLLNLSVFRVLNTVFKTQHFKNQGKGSVIGLRTLWRSHRKKKIEDWQNLKI